MQRVGIVVAVGLGLVMSSAGAALADPSAGPSIAVPAAKPPTTVCSVPDNTTNLTGIVATSSGYVVVDEATTGGPTPVITYLNSDCSRNHTRPFSKQPRDPEDIVTDKNGTLWVADIGDPGQVRPTVAVWKVPPSGPTTIYRFTYPGGTPHLAKAMVLDGDGRPIIITQPSSGAGASELFEPAAGAMVPDNSTGTPLAPVGSFTPEDTGTPNKLAGPGRLLVTGGADSPDGTKVVLRTYSDAYEWTVTGGDVVAAITKTKPLITPMPNEAQGEAISFSADGKQFVTVSNVTSSTPILAYAPASAVVPKATGTGTSKGVTTPKKPSALKAWITSMSLTQLKVMLACIGLFGLALVVIGVLGIRRSRARFQAAAASSGGGRPGSARVPGGGPGGPAGPGGGVYGPGGGPGPSGAPPGGGGVYGAPAGNPGRGGGVYGGAPASPAPAGGGVYGAPRGYDPTAVDPYAAPRPSGPPQGGNYSGGNYSGGNYSGGNYSGGNYSGGDHHGGSYSGGQYGAPVDPYQQDAYPGAGDYGPPADNRRRPPADYDEYR
jgi:hypothetical protein